MFGSEGVGVIPGHDLGGGLFFGFIAVRSPILAFIENKCVVGDGEEVAVDALYNAWTVSCRDDGQNRVTTKATFARDLRAALPSLKKVRKNKNGRRVHFYLGVGLIPPSSGKMSSIMRPRKGRRSKVPRS